MLFSTEMVEAILNDTKTQSRREVLGKTPEMIALMINILSGFDVKENKEHLMNYSKIQKGDVIWVRETWQTAYNEKNDQSDYVYRANGGLRIDKDVIMRWKPSIHMPKNAARIFLKVTDLRIEPLQDISPWDAWNEGIEALNEDYVSEPGVVHGEYKNYLWVDKESYDLYEDYCFPYYTNPVLSFKSLWQKIYGVESWEQNPLVWVISFEKVEKPKGFVIQEQGHSNK